MLEAPAINGRDTLHCLMWDPEIHRVTVPVCIKTGQGGLCADGGRSCLIRNEQTQRLDNHLPKEQIPRVNLNGILKPAPVSHRMGDPGI